MFRHLSCPVATLVSLDSQSSGHRTLWHNKAGAERWWFPSLSSASWYISLPSPFCKPCSSTPPLATLPYVWFLRDCCSSQHLKSRLWFRKSFIWDTVHCLCIIYIIISMSLNWKAESQTGRFPVGEVFCCSYFLQSRKVCCLEVQVTEKKKKRARKSSEVTSPSAVFKSWHANVMKANGLL